MPKEYLYLKMDFMFKQLFGHPSRKRITIAFLNGLLDRIGRDRFVDVEYENTELPKETEDVKMSRLDLLVITNLGERINVEIQVVYQYDMPERVLYYWARLFSFSLSKGQEYSELPLTIMITIFNYPLFPHKRTASTPCFTSGKMKNISFGARTLNSMRLNCHSLW
jgi:predicted transposase/invertase (TIGR01784 family)